MENRFAIDISDPRLFKYWSELAAKDPAQLKREIGEVIEKTIWKTPESKEQHRRELQERIDATWEIDPLESCKRLDKLMAQETDRLTSIGNDLSLEVKRLANMLKGPVGIKRNSAPDSKSVHLFQGETKIISLLKK